MEPLPMEKDSESAGAIDLTDKISACISAERIRNLSERSLKELSIQLTRFNTFCREKGLKDISWRGEAGNQTMKQVTTAPENDRIHRSAVSRNKNVT